MASLSSEERRAIVREEAVARYENYLPLVEDFLMERYGITVETAKRFRLGCAEDPYPQHVPYHGRLCVPGLDASNRVASLKFRCAMPHNCKDEGCTKYLGEPSSEPRLHNPAALVDDKATTLYVTEGEFDTIVLTQLGLTAVGYPGTGNWKSIFTRAISPHDWDRVVVLADGDDAGRAAAKKVAKELKADVVECPAGHDISSLYVKGGYGALAQLLGLDEALEDERYPEEPPF